MGNLTKEVVFEVIEAAQPSFRHAEDTIVFVVHASFIASGFRLLAVNPSPSLCPDIGPHCYPPLDKVGFDKWNQNDGKYGFIYCNPAEGKPIEVGATVCGDYIDIDACRSDDFQIVLLKIRINDYKEENNPYSFKNSGFGKLLEYIEKELVNKYDAGLSSHTEHHSRLSHGNNGNINGGGGVQLDLNRFRRIEVLKPKLMESSNHRREFAIPYVPSQQPGTLVTRPQRAPIEESARNVESMHLKMDLMMLNLNLPTYVPPQETDTLGTRSRRTPEEESVRQIESLHHKMDFMMLHINNSTYGLAQQSGSPVHRRNYISSALISAPPSDYASDEPDDWIMISEAPPRRVAIV